MSLLPSHTSLPDSPTTEYQDIQRSCSFYVDLQSTKKKKEVREKELLLLAHDRLGHEYHTRSIEDLLDDFSSDSLESESSRKCVSDFPLGRQRHDSDTDYSGLNSLQGSGDLLEMLEEEDTQPSEKKGETFYVEIDNSPRKHKPILRAKSLPGGRRSPKPPMPPKLEMKKRGQTKSRLSIRCNLTLLPDKHCQGTDSIEILSASLEYEPGPAFLDFFIHFFGSSPDGRFQLDYYVTTVAFFPFLYSL